MRATPTSVTQIADLALSLLGRLPGIRAASACPGIAQRKTRRGIPSARIQAPFGNKKRARHQAKRYPNKLANSRIELLEQLLAQDPKSLLALYGLAMEYVKQNHLEQAIKQFEAVITVDPNYSAAYFHGGQTLEKLGRLDEAREYYRRGIAVARDPHARGELQAALDILGE